MSDQKIINLALLVAADALESGAVAVGSDGEWVSIRRHVRDATVNVLRGAALPSSKVAPTPAQPSLTQAAADVLAERRRQVEVEGWTPEHDAAHKWQEMARAGIAYALCYAQPQPDWVRMDKHRTPPPVWPWEDRWWKPKGPREDLVRAAALLLAQLERDDAVRAAFLATLPSEPEKS